MAGDQVFGQLTNLRRRLAGAYGMLAEARDLAKIELTDGALSWNVGGKRVNAEAFWSEERARPQAVRVIKTRSIDIRDLPTLLEELLERIETTTRAVNEEIQMAIGSVQVEDARVMRRQTEWTVVLAVLATIYLPMSLVTGIFGMNITEIDAEPPAPNRWSVVRAWGVVFGATMGSVFVYAVVRYVLRYRRIGRMLLGRRMRKIGDGWLYRRVFAFEKRLRKLWLYQQIHGFRDKMREWDLEAQKMEKRE
jgi:Mg2+ and Co2+ transporter CorA